MTARLPRRHDFLLSLLPLTGLATLWVAIHYRGKVKGLEWQIKGLKEALAARDGLLLEQGQAVREWQAKSAAVNFKLATVQSDLERAKTKWKATLAALQSSPMPDGPTVWLVEAAEAARKDDLG